RRHTSFSRDWSSDVCSSDLFVLRRLVLRAIHPEVGLAKWEFHQMTVVRSFRIAGFVRAEIAARGAHPRYGNQSSAVQALDEIEQKSHHEHLLRIGMRVKVLGDDR